MLGSGLWMQPLGANSLIWVHQCGDRPRTTLGQPSKLPPSLKDREHWGHRLLGPYPHCPIPGCSFSLWPEEMDLAGVGRAEEKMLFIFQNRTACSTNPAILKPVKALKQAILTVSLAQVSWLKQESPSPKQGISSCTDNISKALLLLSK